MKKPIQTVLILAALAGLSACVSTQREKEWHTDTYTVPIDAVLMSPQDDRVIILTPRYDFQFSAQKYGKTSANAMPVKPEDRAALINLRHFLAQVPSNNLISRKITVAILRYYPESEPDNLAVSGEIFIELPPNTPLTEQLKPYIKGANIVCFQQNSEQCPNPMLPKNLSAHIFPQAEAQALRQRYPQLREGDIVYWTSFRAGGDVIHPANRQELLTQYRISTPLNMEINESNYEWEKPGTHLKRALKNNAESMTDAFAIPIFLFSSPGLAW